MKQSSSSYEINRKPSVLVVTMKTGVNYIIVKTYKTKNFHLIQVDPYYGSLSHIGVFGVDIFASEYDAILSIASKTDIRSKVQAHTILGYTVNANHGVLLLAKKVEPVFTLFGKHIVFQIKETEVVTFPIKYGNSSTIQISAMRSYPFNKYHYFCHTFDITTAFGKPDKNCFAINDALLSAFKHIPVKGLCPKVLHGLFQVIPLIEYKTEALIIARRRAPDMTVAAGISASGDPHLEAQIEIAMIREFSNGYEVCSNIIHLGGIPLMLDQSFNPLPNSSQATQNFFDSVFEQLEISNITTLSLLSNVSDKARAKLCTALGAECVFQRDDKKSEILPIAVASISSKIGIESAIELIWSKTNAKAKEYGLTKLFISIDKTSAILNQPDEIRLLQNQNGIFRIPLMEKADIELCATFALLLKAAASTDVIGLPTARYNDITRLSATLLSMIADCIVEIGQLFNRFTIVSAQTIAQDIRHVAPTSNNGGDVSSLVDSFRNFASFLPLTKFNATLAKNAFIEWPPNTEYFLQAETPVPQVLNLGLGPITIMLSEPIYLTDIVLEIPSSGLAPPPSCVTIKGGLYTNRIIPVIKDLAIPSSQGQNVTFRYSFERKEGVYDHNLRAFDLIPIRFLQLTFESLASDCICLSGISVFGTSDPPYSLRLTRQNRPQAVPKKQAKAIKPVRAQTLSQAVANVISFEEYRIKYHENFGDFQKVLISSKMKPDDYDINMVFIPRRPDDHGPKKRACCVCGKVTATLGCWGCQGAACKSCMDAETDAEECFCKNCASIKNQLETALVNLNAMKQQFVIENYPFVALHKKKMTVMKRLASKGKLNQVSLIPAASLLNEAPRGADNNQLDFAFAVDVDYAPDTNLINATVCLECYAEISSMEIQCSENLFLIINGAEPESFKIEPPVTKCCFELTTRKLELTIGGPKIRISRIKVYGKPAKLPELPLPMSDGGCSVRFIPVPADIRFSTKRNAHIFSFSCPTTIVGFRFAETWKHLNDVLIELLVEDSEAVILHRKVGPCTQSQLDLLLTEPYRVVEARIWYTKLTHKEASAIANSIHPIPLTTATA